MKTITVHIGRLVLEGLSIHPREGRQVQAAVERELTRLFADGRLATELTTSRAVASLATPSIDVAGNANAGAVGERIAGAVHAGLGATS
jgi:hypothetical protein